MRTLSSNFSKSNKGEVLHPLSWMRRIEGWALFAFAVGATFLFGEGQQRSLAILMVIIVFIVNSINNKKLVKTIFPIPPEILLYTGWVIWSGVTGFFVAADFDDFLKAYLVLLQIFTLVWISYLIMSKINNIDVIFMSLIAGALIQFIVIFKNGIPSLSSMATQYAREIGTYKNPNGLGFLMVWSVVSIFLYWEKPRKNVIFKRLAFVIFVLLSAYVLLATGSRKSAMALALVSSLWILFAIRNIKNVKNIFTTVFISMFLIFILQSVMPLIAESTPVGVRFGELEEAGGGSAVAGAENDIRYTMYVDGFGIFADHPITGVGVNNFQQYFFVKMFSHSNYIEPLATTGLLGFLLYQSFYLIIILRTFLLLKTIKNQKIIYRLKIILIGMGAILFIGFGAPFYVSSQVYLMLTAFSVYTWNLRHYLKQKQQYATLHQTVS